MNMKLKFVITENQFNNLYKKFILEGYTYDSDVKEIQKELKGKYNLGKYGSEKDGVDGLLGPLTKRAMEKEIKVNPDVKEKYETILQRHYGESDVEYDEKAKEYEDDYSQIKPKDSSDVVIFVSGLHHRKNDLSVSQQEEKIKKGLQYYKTIFSYSHRDTDSALSKLKEFPNATVVLFSAGTGYSSKFASKMDKKSNLFIVEPYPKAEGSVTKAVSMGVPNQNVIQGGGRGSGKGMVAGATNTPKEFAGHWPALTFIGQVIS